MAEIWLEMVVKQQSVSLLIYGTPSIKAIEGLGTIKQPGLIKRASLLDYY